VTYAYGREEALKEGERRPSKSHWSKTELHKGPVLWPVSGVFVPRTLSEVGRGTRHSTKEERSTVRPEPANSEEGKGWSVKEMNVVRIELGGGSEKSEGTLSGTRSGK